MQNKYKDFGDIHRKSYGKSLEKETFHSEQHITSSVIPQPFVRSKPIQSYGSTYSTIFFKGKGLEESFQSLKDHHKSQNYYSLKNLKFKWKHNDVGLRQTEDSIRHFNKKRSINIREFKKLKLIGKGRHGIVYLAVHKETNFIGALKVFKKEDFDSPDKEQRVMLRSLLIKELKIQSFINHPGILKVYSIFSDQKCVYLFMELGTDGELLNVLNKRKTLKEESVSFALKGLLQAIRHLHEHNIIHRDLKPQNIVLTHGFPKICDFGQSSVCNKNIGELRETLCGTPLYLSPQILMGEKYDEKIDIWALGAMAFELYTGNNPFNIKQKQELNRIITDQFQMTKGSLELRNFLIYCMKKNPKERPSADKLLRHPFIKKWSELQTSEELCK